MEIRHLQLLLAVQNQKPLPVSQGQTIFVLPRTLPAACTPWNRATGFGMWEACCLWKKSIRKQGIFFFFKCIVRRVVVKKCELPDKGIYVKSDPTQSAGSSSITSKVHARSVWGSYMQIMPGWYRSSVDSKSGFCTLLTKQTQWS